MGATRQPGGGVAAKRVVVSAMTDDEKQHILAEARAHLDGTWTPEPSPVVRKSDDPGLVYKVRENSEPEPAPAADGDGILSDPVIQLVADCVDNYGKQMSDLRRDVDVLTGKVDALLRLLQGKAADVLPLSGRKSAS
jgi:hypothetical protein